MALEADKKKRKQMNANDEKEYELTVNRVTEVWYVVCVCGARFS